MSSETVSKPHDTEKIPHLEWNGKECRNYAAWRGPMARLLILLYGLSVQAWAQEGGGTGLPPVPQAPIFEPLTSEAAMEDDQSKASEPPSDRWWYRSVLSDTPRIVGELEREQILDLHRMMLGEHAKSMYKDYHTKPKVIQTIIAHVSKDALGHLKRQPRYHALIADNNAEGLWRLIEETFSHVDTGVLIEDFIEWLKRMLNTRQRKDETLSDYLLRFDEMGLAFNTWLRGARVEGVQFLSDAVLAGIYMRGLDTTCTEARKAILNNTIFGFQKYPESPREVFNNVAKFRVSTLKVKDGAIVPTGVNLIASGPSTQNHPKSKDNKKKDSKPPANYAASSKGGGKGTKEPVRHKSGDPVKCNFKLLSGQECGGNHWRRDCPHLKALKSEVEAEESAKKKSSGGDDDVILVMETLLALGSSQLGPRAVLLDTQCSVNASVICDARLLQDIRSRSPLRVTGVGQRTIDREGDTVHFGTVLFDPSFVANVLSFSMVMARYRVEWDQYAHPPSLPCTPRQRQDHDLLPGQHSRRPLHHVAAGQRR
jgi:hypothetical protein